MSGRCQEECYQAIYALDRSVFGDPRDQIMFESCYAASEGCPSEAPDDIAHCAVIALARQHMQARQEAGMVSDTRGTMYYKEFLGRHTET